MRERIAKYLWGIYSDEGEGMGDFYEQADSIIKKFCEEIEKVGNPFINPDANLISKASHIGYETSRQAILTLLRSEKEV